MNNKYLDSCIEKIKAIQKDQLTKINAPIEIYLQEAENLYHWCLDDIPQLSEAGISAEKIEELNLRAGACREAQSIWTKDRRLIKDIEKNWIKSSSIAFDLRDELLHIFKYAFRYNKELLQTVNEISRGGGNDDMIQDLNNLAVFGEQNKDKLISIGFDMEKLNKAAKISSDIADLLAIVVGNRRVGNESKIIRDKAYTYLKQLVDQVRICGKYVFWKNPERLKGYKSRYWKRWKKTKKKKQAPTSYFKEKN